MNKILSYLTIILIISGVIVGFITSILISKTENTNSMNNINYPIGNNYELINKTSDFEKESIDTATSFFNQSWGSAKQGGLFDVGQNSRLVDDNYRDISYITGSYEMIDNAKNSNGVFLGPDNIIDQVILIDNESSPSYDQLPKKGEMRTMTLCVNQTKEQVRYVDIDGIPDKVEGSTSWIVTTLKKDNEWKVINAKQYKGCYVPQ